MTIYIVYDEKLKQVGLAINTNTEPVVHSDVPAGLRRELLSMVAAIEQKQEEWERDALYKRLNGLPADG